LFADGYVEAEVTTPEMKELKNITGLTVKMKKTADGTKTVLPKQFLFGAVTRNGRPVKTGWVGLWYVRKNLNSVNAPVLRGRVVDGLTFYLEHAAIVNGSYRLEMPDDDEYFVVAEEPGHAPTQIGPIGVKLRQERKSDIACVKGGSISGKVNDSEGLGRAPLGDRIHENRNAFRESNEGRRELSAGGPAARRIWPQGRPRWVSRHGGAARPGEHPQGVEANARRVEKCSRRSC
jgi:hypothetical protein